APSPRPHRDPVASRAVDDRARTSARAPTKREPQPRQTLPLSPTPRDFSLQALPPAHRPATAANRQSPAAAASDPLVDTIGAGVAPWPAPAPDLALLSAPPPASRRSCHLRIAVGR